MYVTLNRLNRFHLAEGRVEEVTVACGSLAQYSLASIIARATNLRRDLDNRSFLSRAASPIEDDARKRKRRAQISVD